jgi:hypothetical protein
MREVSIPAIIPATLMARRAFYALGRKTVYTNSYKDCHTVKAYRTGSGYRDLEIQASIFKLLSQNEYNGVTTSMTKRAIIIRIPKSVPPPILSHIEQQEQLWK